MTNNEQGVIVEFVKIGNTVKVIAIDEATGIEAIIVGSPAASKKDLTALAVRKLRYVMSKR